MATFVDKTGTPLMVGDYIIYAYNLGRCASLRYAKVLGMKDVPNKSWGPITVSKLQIRGCDFYPAHEAFPARPGRYQTGWEAAPATPARAQLLSQASWLEFPDRVICIGPHQMPPEVLAELAPI